MRDEPGQELAEEKLALGIRICCCSIPVIDYSVDKKEDLRVVIGDGLLILA